MLDFINTKTKKVKPGYKKPESIRELERLHFEAKQLRHPDTPYLVRTKFRDDSANELTRAVVAHIQLHGGFAARINSTGINDAKLGRYRRSGARKGVSDIQAVIGGRSISIEVKIGRDRMRPDQIKVKAEVEQSGGVYIIASSFDDFLEKINKI